MAREHGPKIGTKNEKNVARGTFRAAALKAVPDSASQTLLACKLRITIRGEAQNPTFGHPVTAPLTVAIQNFGPKPRGGVVWGFLL